MSERDQPRDDGDEGRTIETTVGETTGDENEEHSEQGQGQTLGEQAGTMESGDEQPALDPMLLRGLVENFRTLTPADVDALPDLTPEQKYEIKQTRSLEPQNIPGDDGTWGEAYTDEAVTAWVEYEPDADSPDAIEARYERIEQQRARGGGGGGAEPDPGQQGQTNAQAAMTDADGGAGDDAPPADADPALEASEWAARLVSERSTETCLTYLAALSIRLSDEEAER